MGSGRMVGYFHEKAGKVNAPLLARRFRVCQSPNRPASIRTLCGAVCSGASWRPLFSTGAAISEPN